MNRIIIVNQRQDQLAKQVAHLLPQASIQEDFHWPVQDQDVICWLSNDNSRVDLTVNDLVTLLDQQHVRPAKIIMKSIVGTADDADDQQLINWYGAQARQLVADHLYAIKMIDELEFPYTIVRTLPLTSQPVHRQLCAEGQRMEGQQSNMQDVARVLAQACQPEQLKNVSVGI